MESCDEWGMGVFKSNLPVWMLAILSALPPLAKGVARLLDFIGLAGIPSDLIVWRNLIGLSMNWTVGILLVGMALAFAASVWLKPFRKIPHRAMQRDIPLQHASFFIVSHRWPSPQEKPFTETLIGTDVSNALQKLRQAALDGQLKIWGRLKHDSVFAEVEPSFWKENDIDFLSAYMGQNTPDKPFSKSFEDGEGRYAEFQVSKSQVESIWGPSVENLVIDAPFKFRAWHSAIAVAAILVIVGIFSGETKKEDASFMKYIWKPLTEKESTDIVEKLRPLVSSKIVLSCSQLECRDLAQSLKSAFKQAGWSDTELSVGGVDTVGIDGVAIYPQDAISRTLREIIETSTDMSVTLYGEERKVTDYPATYISIGPKPF
jgi:hypothetical protein